MQVVTSLININRVENDGRTVDDYLSWLYSLLEIFPDAVVFHDGSADRLISVFSDAQFVEIKINEVNFFPQINVITEICIKYLDMGKQDLVYLNPLYGIVTMAKFEFMRRALALSEDQHFLWVDAGVLRLYKSPREWKFENFTNMIQKGFDGALFEIDLLPRRGRLWPRIPQVGSSDRLIGTSVMLADRRAIDTLDISVTEIAQRWIDQREWDTEQVAVAKLWKAGFNFNFYVQKWRSPTSILGALHARHSSLRSLPFLPKESLITKTISWIVC